jgi:D-lactate dehydrogenase (cytochrome)
MEGTVTGEHGIGLALRDILVEELGGDAIDMMRKVNSQWK